MANVKWGKSWQSVFVSADALSEALRLPNDVMFGVWLGAVGDDRTQFDEGIVSAWQYDALLRGEGEIDEAEAERRRSEWNAGEGAAVSAEEVERRRCGLSEWNGMK
jgi:hypothetical protein